MAEIGKDILTAKKILTESGLVAIPTETVYGLAANAFDEKAVIKIFEAKNRPLFDPLILHTNSIEKIKLFVKEIPESALKLVEKFWPGPLTLLLPKKEIVPDLVTSGLRDVAVRIPDHTLTLELLSQLEFPLAAPSANLFGYVSPTSALHVHQQLGEKIEYILDGGECKVGIESTIVGFEKGKAIVFRLGGLAIEEIENVCGKVELRINNSSNPNAPGQLKSHYATKKPLCTGNIDEAIEKFQYKRMGVISFCKEYPGQLTKTLSPKGNLEEAAQNLFKAMRELDENDSVDFIYAEVFPSEFLGRAINDRLQRASVF
ncbi:MAG: threonylcarbamoyl-AMP synthase [Bacteroidia bacterium]|nr:threonylcarbamoyl-AMP synthase [Bacteroidia bacterium]